MTLTPAQPFTAIANIVGAGRKKSPLTLRIESLETGHEFTIDYGKPTHSRNLYPIISRIKTRMSRNFVCRRVSGSAFKVSRVA